MKTEINRSSYQLATQTDATEVPDVRAENTSLMTATTGKDKSTPPPTDDLEDLLGFGPYHHFQIWVVQTLVAFIGALNYFHLYFMVTDPPVWGCEDKNIAYDPDNGIDERCAKPVLNSSQSGVSGEICMGGNVTFNTTHQNFLYSLAVENHWLCSKALHGATILSAAQFGQVFNSLIFGQLSDIIGRLPVFHITNILFILGRFISFQFPGNFTSFVLLTAAGSGFFPCGVRAGYTIVAEMCNEKGRRMAFISGWVFWVFGMVALPFIALYFQNWYHFGMATSLCNLIFILLYPVFPESPRWLLDVKKFDKAAAVIAKMRKYNGDKEIPDLKEVLEKIVAKREEDHVDEAKVSILTCYKYKNLVWLTFLMSVVYTVNDYFYLAGSLNVENLAGSIFVNFAVVALTEMPSVFIGQFIIDKWGRRWCHVLCMVLTTLSLTVNLILVAFKGTEGLVVAMSIVAKTASNVGWFIMWVQSIELFPTSFRNTGINIAATVSIVISMSGPFVVELGSLHSLHYPYLVFVLLGLAGILATSFLPESKSCPLPEHPEELNRMWTRPTFFAWRVWLLGEEDEEEERGEEMASRKEM